MNENYDYLYFSTGDDEDDSHYESNPIFPRETIYHHYAYDPGTDEVYGMLEKEDSLYYSIDAPTSYESEPLPKDHPRYAYLLNCGRIVHKDNCRRQKQQSAIDPKRNLYADLPNEARATHIAKELQAVLDKYQTQLTLISDTDDYFEFGIVLDGQVFPI